MNSLTICFSSLLTIWTPGRYGPWPRAKFVCAARSWWQENAGCAGLAGNPGELLGALLHLFGRRQAKQVEHGPDAVEPIVPEGGLPDIPGADRRQSLLVAVQVHQ